MKKHPIDDLFKEKLSEIERKPSSRAWERIESAQKKEDKKWIGWVWYATAGLFITLFAGYLFKMNVSTPLQTATLAQTGKMENAKEKELPKQPAQLVIPEIKEETVNVLAKAEPKREKVQEKPSIEPAVIADSPALEETQVAEVRPIENIPQVLPQNEIRVAEVVVPVVEEKAEVSRTIVVAVHAPAEQEMGEKKTRLGKIFRQLKNVKEGEAVDWNEVGFNPKAIVARVDDRLKQGEGKVSDKYQNFKERTKL